jgi:hypothetical protein
MPRLEDRSNQQVSPWNTNAIDERDSFSDEIRKQRLDFYCPLAALKRKGHGALQLLTHFL